MSFLGCIGHIVKGSGIEEILELVYAKNVVPHILSGKVTVARAIRGHRSVDAALNALLVSHTFHLPLSDTLDEVDTVEDQQEATEAPRPSINEDLEQAKVSYSRLVENSDARQASISGRNLVHDREEPAN